MTVPDTISEVYKIEPKYPFTFNHNLFRTGDLDIYTLAKSLANPKQLEHLDFKPYVMYDEVFIDDKLTAYYPKRGVDYIVRNYDEFDLAPDCFQYDVLGHAHHNTYPIVVNKHDLSTLFRKTGNRFDFSNGVTVDKSSFVKTDRYIYYQNKLMVGTKIEPAFVTEDGIWTNGRLVIKWT